MLIRPRSEVEPLKVLPSHTDGPRFSFGSKASELEDASGDRHIDCTSIHGSELSMGRKSRAPTSQVPSANLRHSLATSTGYTDSPEPEKLGSVIGCHYDELKQSVEEQASKEPRTRANTGSTIQMENEPCSTMNHDYDGRSHVEDQPTSKHRTDENDSQQKAYLNHRQPSLLSKGRPTDLASPMFKIKAQEISRAVASEVSACLSNTHSSPEDIELIVQTRVMSLLNEVNPRKRKNGEIELEDSAQPNVKRITCSICPKTVGRPCDLK